jgi:hypothetical protein
MKKKAEDLLHAIITPPVGSCSLPPMSATMSAIALTDIVASFLQAKFRAILSRSDQQITPSVHIPTQLVVDCEAAAHVLASAVMASKRENSECMCYLFTLPSQNWKHSQDQVGWDAEHYSHRLEPRQNGMHADKELSSMKNYPPLFQPNRFLTEPTIIFDIHGKILVWYLPGIMTQSRQECYWFSVCSHIHESLLTFPAGYRVESTSTD